MEALIQHNVHNGIGDYIHSIYRYFYLTEELKKIGYNKITLYINMERTLMFNKDYFFVLFDKKEFDDIFDNIIISDKKLSLDDYNNLEYYYVNGNKEIGMNQFDLFIDVNDEKFSAFKNNLHNLFPSNTIVKYRNLFSEFVINKYKEKNIYCNNDYVSIQFRARDSQDNDELYINHEEQFKNIIFGNKKVFVCSNSFKFKQYIKSFDSSNVFMFDYPFEEKYGNHLGGLSFNEEFGYKEYESRTLDAVIDMLTLSQSNEIFSFNYFGEVYSNFLRLATAKNVKINIIPVIGGMMWTPNS
jgi:hypothetical protein